MYRVRVIVRAVATVAAAALLLGLTVSWMGGEVYYYVAGADLNELSKAEVPVGESLALHAREHETGTGCDDPYDGAVTEGLTWTVEPATGARMDDGTFVADEPGTYTVTPVIAGAPAGVRIDPLVITVAEDGSATIDQPAEVPAEVSPFVGTWEYVGWFHGQKWTPETGVIVDEWEWNPATGPAQLTIEQSGDTFSVTGWGAGSITIDGTSIRIYNEAEGGFSMTLEGTISGDTITGTQSYTDDDAGPHSAEWVAKRVQ